MFRPKFTISPLLSQLLMSIEAARQAVMDLPVDIEMLASLRETARLVATHFSTQIEGNRLTQAQVEETLRGARFPGRERDETEVKNYYRALEEVEKLSGETTLIQEIDIQRIHGLVMQGRSVPTPYRDGQNVVRDSASGRIIYMPPEASDVVALMAELVSWTTSEIERSELPIPLVAALAHYQFATIHPYYDGNGRTARLLTNLILHKTGYGLKGIYNLEEYYARNLSDYYATLAVGESHNYYLGRKDADVSAFVEYFCGGMSEAFVAVRVQASEAAKRNPLDRSPLLRKLDPRRRQLLVLFRRQDTANTTEIAKHLGLSQRTIVALCQKWVVEEFLEMDDPSRKNRSYRLAKEYEQEIQDN